MTARELSTNDLCLLLLLLSYPWPLLCFYDMSENVRPSSHASVQSGNLSRFTATPSVAAPPKKRGRPLGSKDKSLKPGAVRGRPKKVQSVPTMNVPSTAEQANEYDCMDFGADHENWEDEEEEIEKDKRELSRLS